MLLLFQLNKALIEGVNVQGTKHVIEGKFCSISKTYFSFQFIASYGWYSKENLAGDLLFGLKLVKLPILPTLFIHFV